MRAKIVFGVFLVSAALCSSGFGFEILDRLLGLEGCGEGACGAPRICAPAACAKVGCEAGCESACMPRCTPVRDLLCIIKVRLCCDYDCDCGPACCERSCEPKRHKLYRRPVVELLENLFCCDRCCDARGEEGCCGECENGQGSGGGFTSAPTAATAPAKKPAAPNTVPIPKPAE